MNPQTSSHPNLIEKLPKEVESLFKIFGDEIRLVGGCVRDLLVEKDVNDFDFATRFLPQEIIDILEKNKVKAVPTGIKFGTITAVVNGKNFEITTLRKDEESDGRHCNPKFVDDYFLDASRRDFTINALYLDSKGEISDYFDGISDLKEQKVRFIGDENIRIEEDYLRILRFFRFSCRYSQDLDQKGLKACIFQKENLKKLSRERIRAELIKMLSGENKDNIIAILTVLQSEKIADEIFSEGLNIKALNHLFIIEKKLEMVTNLSVKLAVLFLQTESDSKIFAKEICATNAEKRFFARCREFTFDQKRIGMLLAAGEQNFILDQYLVFMAKNFDAINFPEAKENIKFLQNFSLPIFPINGDDIMAMGFKGKAVGQVIIKLKEHWVEGNFKANKEDLITFLKDK